MTGATCQDELVPIDWERLARVELQPLRIDILELLRLDGGRSQSASEMAFELHHSYIGKVHHHAKVLVAAGFIVVINHHQVRGATEHFFCLEGHDGSDLLRRAPFAA